MTDLHFIQIGINLAGVIQHIRKTGTSGLLRAIDEGTLVKTAFAETFGTHLWPKPFQVRSRFPDGRVEVYGYSARGIDDLKAGWMPPPSLAGAIPLDGMFGYKLPDVPAGWHARFSVRFCPIVSTYGDRARGIRAKTRDIYSLEVERVKRTQGEDAPLPERSTVYERYLRERMAGAAVDSLFLEGVSLQTTPRKAKDRVEGRKETFLLPVVVAHGALTVTDPAAFRTLLATGVGKRRTYGHGMLLLGAAAMAPDRSAPRAA